MSTFKIGSIWGTQLIKLHYPKLPSNLTTLHITLGSFCHLLFSFCNNIQKTISQKTEFFDRIGHDAIRREFILLSYYRGKGRRSIFDLPIIIIMWQTWKFFIALAFIFAYTTASTTTTIGHRMDQSYALTSPKKLPHKALTCIYSQAL